MLGTSFHRTFLLVAALLLLPLSARAGLETVGPAGGVVTAGNWTLRVPAGAFSEEVSQPLQLLAMQGSMLARISGYVPVGLDLPMPMLVSPVPAKPLELSVYLSPAEVDQLTDGGGPDYLAIWGQPVGTAGWHWVGGRIHSNSRGTTVTTEIYAPGSYDIGYATNGWADICDGANLFNIPRARWAIARLAAAGILQGVVSPHYDPTAEEFVGGRFFPQKPITRAEFTKMLVLADGLSPVSGIPSGFADVSKGTWYYPYVAAARQAGLVRGTGGGDFSPQSPLTIEQAAALLSRLPKLPEAPTATPGPDLHLDPWARAGIGLLLGEGWITERPNDSFQFMATVNRAEAAVLLADYLSAAGRL